MALSSAVTGFAITTAAGFVAGETVLIQGATGVAGRLAVQVARKLGAGRIVATGRDDASLADVAALGADAVITTAVADEELVAAYTEHAGDGYDVVLDFLWGRPTGLLTRALVPDRIALTKPTRLVQVGASAGPTIALDAESVRTSGLEIYGATKGIDGETMGRAYAQVVQWARDRELDFNLVTMPLSQIEAAWQRTDLRGKRLVIVP